MNKTEAVRALIDASNGEPTVFTTGYACRIARGIEDRPNHFYMTGSMGLASSIGIGIAQQTGRPTIVVDGDGSLLMNPVGLLTAGSLGPLPLVHVVMDDARYASTGGQQVPSAGTDLAALARACGYPRVYEVDHVEALATRLRVELATCTSPVFIRCVLRGEDPPISARVDCDLGAHAARFSGVVRELVAR
jgi:sulfopyruvate decarboxylase subunit beta